MKTSPMWILIAALTAGCATEHEPVTADDGPGGKGDDPSTRSDLLLSCSATYRFEAGGASFEFEPRGDEIQVAIAQETNGGGIDVWRTLDAQRGDLTYHVKLWIERENEHSNYLEYSVASASTGATAAGISYPEKLASHGFLVRLAAPKGASFGETTATPSGQPAAITGAGLSCRIGTVMQNTNLETTYPTLETVPLP